MYNDIKVLIIGTDINAYYMSRCYHELTGKKADLIGKAPMAFTSVSNITNIKIEDNLWDSKVFVETLINYANEQNYVINRILNEIKQIDNSFKIQNN